MVLDLESPNRKSVDQDMIRHNAKLSNRAPNRESAGVVDIQPIDLTDGRSPKADADRASQDLDGEFPTFGCTHGLGVRDAIDSGGVRVHDDGACDNGARKRAPSDFVNSGQQEPASRA
jgi:hypothetical protein